MFAFETTLRAGHDPSDLGRGLGLCVDNRLALTWKGSAKTLPASDHIMALKLNHRRRRQKPSKRQQVDLCLSNRSSQWWHWSGNALRYLFLCRICNFLTYFVSAKWPSCWTATSFSPQNSKSKSGSYPRICSQLNSRFWPTTALHNFISADRDRVMRTEYSSWHGQVTVTLFWFCCVDIQSTSMLTRWGSEQQINIYDAIHP